jgi:uncharacterized protein involved in tolerance to divalent cations
MPKIVSPGEWKAPIINDREGKAQSGLSLAYLTVDTEEAATRFIKDLFKEGLISQVQMFEHGFKRTFLKFGRKHTETTRYRLEMVVPDSKVKNLIDYTNKNNPTSYDYPVPDVTAIPITTGNQKFLEWAVKPAKIDYEKIYK